MAKDTITIIYNCELVNKRYDTNGNPIYDINFSHDKEGAEEDTLKGVQTYAVGYKTMKAFNIRRTKKLNTLKCDYITNNR